MSGETPGSFQALIQSVSLQMNRHGNEICSIENQLLMTLIWLRQYPTYTLLSLTFGVSVRKVGVTIKNMWLKLWEVCSPMSAGLHLQNGGANVEDGTRCQTLLGVLTVPHTKFCCH